jgi:hypothetical protein
MTAGTVVPFAVFVERRKRLRRVAAALREDERNDVDVTKAPSGAAAVMVPTVSGEASAAPATVASVVEHDAQE